MKTTIDDVFSEFAVKAARSGGIGREELQELQERVKQQYELDVACRLKQEQTQYREALTRGALCSFWFDVTDGWIREQAATDRGADVIASAGRRLPVGYDALNEILLQRFEVKLRDEAMRDCLTCRGLLRRFEEGNARPEWECYEPTRDRYTKVTVYLYRDMLTGHVCGLLAAHDTSAERKREEEQRLALQAAYDAADQANQAKKKFLSDMSHDIRTPMNVIIGMTAIAGARLDDRGRVEECLAKITAASGQLMDFLNEVLDMSKIDTGVTGLQEEEFGLSDFVEQLLVRVRPEMEEKGHIFLVTVDKIEHERVIGDRRKLEQAFLNLLGNAVKYTPEGGTIHLSVSEQAVKRTDVAGFRFVFEDNGIGMSEAFLEQLFEPFSRAEDDRISRLQGAGLGMTITRNIVQMMNGDIQVESQLDKGTKVTVHIYLKRATPALERLQQQDYRGKKALLAEDNQLNAELAGELLGMTGLQVEYAEDGRRAVEMVTAAGAEGYDIIFMDIEMPVMDGYAAARAIRALPMRDSERLPIIAMTANAFSEDEMAVKRAGMNEHLVKPINLNQLLDILRHWLGRR